MGDVVLASCAFQDIHEAFPQAEIHLNTLPPWNRLFLEDPRFKKIICFDLRGEKRGVPAMLRWVRETGRGGYDAIIDLQSNDRSRILMSLLWLSGRAPRYRVGNHRRFPYNVAPPPLSGWPRLPRRRCCTLRGAIWNAAATCCAETG